MRLVSLAERGKVGKWRWGWLGLSLGVALYFGGVTLGYLWRYPYIVQDDARQHVVFLQQLVDAGLFANDWIAEYFTTVAPVGYKLLYMVAAKLGIAPLEFAKVLPLLLSLVTTVYLFGVCWQLLPIPLTGFLSTLILNQQLWLNDDLVSATPRAFVYPIFVAFLYYLLRQSLLACLVTIVLQGLFFPQLVLVQMIVLLLRLWRWPNRPSQRWGMRLGWLARLGWQGSESKADYQFAFWGLLTAGLVLLPYALTVTKFGGAITVEQMRMMPEYGLQGRNEYFGVSGWQFWLLGNSGIRVPVFPSIILAGCALPMLRRSQWPLMAAVSEQIKLLGQVLLASLILYGAAHLLLLKLHFPSRYTYHTLRIILAIAAAIVLTVLLDAGWRWLRYKQRIQSRLTNQDRGFLALIAFLTAVVIVVPALPFLFLRFQGWVIGEAPSLYQYLAAQPQSTLVASLDPEASNLPAFTQRSTLMGREFALPHHPIYYQQFQQRVIDLIGAQYSLDSSVPSQFIEQYDINFFLIGRSAFTPAYLNQDWLIHSSFQDLVRQVAQQLEQGRQPVLLQTIPKCQVAASEKLILLDAVCVQQF
ncbi:MAG: hypothetical protein IGS54_30080 [Elainella sp. C42_A2020_010]|nr:hypothetical protein [Elainella sp. C42_A2020_010]